MGEIGATIPHPSKYISFIQPLKQLGKAYLSLYNPLSNHARII